MNRTQSHLDRIRKDRSKKKWLKSLLDAPESSKIQSRLFARDLLHLYMNVSEPRNTMGEYLTTVPDVDAAYEWPVYYRKFNLRCVAWKPRQP